MKTRTLVTTMAAISAAAILAAAAPASAETFTSADGVISVELPNENWKEVADPNKWIALSDGANLITIDHYSNGESLPAMTIADDHYVNVYDVAFSTQNEVFIITGSVVDAAQIDTVRNAITSVKVLQLDTKLAVKKEATQTASGFTVVPLDATMYITGSGVNVRSGWSTNDAVIGGLGNGEAVKVTGKVQQNGTDFGWYEISINGGKGYVSSQFLTGTKADGTTSTTTDTNKTTERKYTGNVKTVYDENGNALTIYEADDSNWYDSKGNAYARLDDYQFSSGSKVYSSNKPASSSGLSSTGYTVNAFWLNGNGETLTQYSDGYYYSNAGVRYYYSDGLYYGADGTKLYSYEQNLGGYSDDADINLTSRGSGRPVDISDNGYGEYIDDEGNYYEDNGDGTFTDEDGNLYDAH